MGKVQQWTETREYNSRLQARGLQVVKDQQTLLGLHWTYSDSYNTQTFEETAADNYGNLQVEQVEDTSGTYLRQYNYDTANRVTSYSEPGKSQSFGYDAFGNLWQTEASGVPALRPNGSSWYLVNNQVTNRMQGVSYDAAGNQTQLSISPGGTVASYDAEGRMAEVTVGEGTLARYGYDAEGRRVKKSVFEGGEWVTTYYVYDAAGQLMAEYGGSGTESGTQYVVADYLGSTRLLLDGQGACEGRIDYAPFGAMVRQDCDAPGSGYPLFTGQMRDGETAIGAETGQDYFGARYFWAALGRFTSPDEPLVDQDPFDPRSWNLYSYVRGNPLILVDPTGRGCEVVDGIDRDNPDVPGPSCAEISQADSGTIVKRTKIEKGAREYSDGTSSKALGVAIRTGDSAVRAKRRSAIGRCPEDTVPDVSANTGG